MLCVSQQRRCSKAKCIGACVLCLFMARDCPCPDAARGQASLLSCQFGMEDLLPRASPCCLARRRAGSCGGAQGDHPSNDQYTIKQVLQKHNTSYEIMLCRSQLVQARFPWKNNCFCL